ncbi:ERF family protein, partial [Acinetobacter baumannii]|nr:ERF family protein [Acinetobacter baumannii]
IETIYKFVNVENPEESIEIISYGDGIDTQDKAVGKAMTYADKYALMKAYKIISGDDPDQDKSPDNVVRLVKTELTKDEKDALRELAKSK